MSGTLPLAMTASESFVGMQVLAQDKEVKATFIALDRKLPANLKVPYMKNAKYRTCICPSSNHLVDDCVCEDVIIAYTAHRNNAVAALLYSDGNVIHRSGTLKPKSQNRFDLRGFLTSVNPGESSKAEAGTSKSTQKAYDRKDKSPSKGKNSKKGGKKSSSERKRKEYSSNSETDLSSDSDANTRKSKRK
ncbi:nonstructural protein [Rice dwarf virus]|uniref:RNA-binding protein n=1 Tax=Rice dwarf virus (isolate Fujian) TaxID=142804 RepID=NSP11_RDVF|nr:nonstructural protein [Rice dwarf virus]Q85442.1 RecName: Full=RNA-binding protein; AltName: Full=Non-structural protein 11; Short=Pns11 [Rice dwarf virus (isolate Fujian)]AAA88767.1 nonstructural protein [Rice dwarf virus]